MDSHPVYTRRAWLGAAAGAAALALSGRSLWAGPAAGPEITVYKSPTCGCCSKWVDHLKAGGFSVRSHDVPDVGPIKRKHGIPDRLSSCHTGLVGGYAVEGHVPADVIRKLLKERPRAVGLAVPGMPMGSPGMEGPHRDRYDVLLVLPGGATRVYASR